MDAWWDLIHRDFIDFRTKKINDIGYNYLQERKLDKVDQISVPVCIDGLIGTITMDNPQLMRNKNVRENGLRALHPVIPDINENNIEFQQVKHVISSYREIDEDYYEGDLLDVSKVEGNKTFYKRLYVVFYSNNDGHTRISVFQGNEREDKYEQALIALDSSGYYLLKQIPDTYPAVDFISKLGLKGDTLGPGLIFNNWVELIKKSKSKILISLPMIELCSPDDMLINLLTDALARGVHVTITNSGREFASGYQKEQYSKLLKISSNNIELIHVPLFWHKFIIIDEQEGILSNYQKHNIYLAQTQVGYVESGYSLNKNAIEYIQMSLVNPEIESLKTLIPKQIDKKWLDSKMDNIMKLVNALDDKLKVQNGVGWLGDYPIPNKSNVRMVPKAVNETTFKEFINTANQSFSESVDFTGKRANIPRYFWGNFKSLCPSVQRILHKIRMYRNFANHLEIDSNYKAIFYEYLDEDLLGRLPQFVKNGYLYLQIKLIEDLEKKIQNSLS